ncbi:2Fe-2S iron-sulfur cluster-binding protein [Leucobacter tenebrionis]|uniref:2Fe-2S iron-sulfur cluster-binding protein n=1 Tax=Leucobacter tenebrionis TaxID=2873270 RepID=UPI001CA70932|nr:2Fe-2S iron-sulfur cluster-binding protein [Leucobacter tenebrionis]QZY52586.1 (2Fe-2S)-binding protein [Leucobacter tenebrionis]
MTADRELSFTFEGRSVTAREGQSIAGALRATGRRTLSRGVKYHRPRGYTCGFGACGDCPLKIDGMPATVSCTTPVRGGEVVRREGGFPNAGFDLLRAADLMRPFLKAGFQFKLFARQPRLSKLAGAVLGALAGGGRAPSAEAVARATGIRVSERETDLLVIGGGASGLAAALAAADTGASVLLVDHELLGGRSRVRTEPIRVGDTERRPSEIVGDLLRRAADHPGIEVLRGSAIGLIDGLVPVVEAGGEARHDVRAAAIVLATGSYEVPILVPGHDLPGVVLADGALRLAALEGVRPGRRAVVIDGDPRAAAVAEELGRFGVEVVARVPARQVVRVTGWSRATGVLIREGDHGSGSAPRSRPRRVRADLICVVGPRRPAEELALHAAYGDAGSHERVVSDAAVGLAGDRVAVVGSARGEAGYSLEAVAAEGTRIAGVALRERRSGGHDPAHTTSGSQAEVFGTTE